jgi:hypothetical protein
VPLGLEVQGRGRKEVRHQGKALAGEGLVREGPLQGVEEGGVAEGVAGLGVGPLGQEGLEELPVPRPGRQHQGGEAQGGAEVGPEVLHIPEHLLPPPPLVAPDKPPLQVAELLLAVLQAWGQEGA